MWRLLSQEAWILLWPVPEEFWCHPGPVQNQQAAPLPRGKMGVGNINLYQTGTPNHTFKCQNVLSCSFQTLLRLCKLLKPRGLPMVSSTVISSLPIFHITSFLNAHLWLASNTLDNWKLSMLLCLNPLNDKYYGNNLPSTDLWLIYIFLYEAKKQFACRLWHKIQISSYQQINFSVQNPIY